MSQQGMSVGGFGKRALERSVLEDVFVTAEVQQIMFSEVVQYYSGPVGSGPQHTAPESVYTRWDKRGRDVRKCGVESEIYLRLFVKEASETVLIKMSAKEMVQFGTFSSITGDFILTVDEVSVKLGSEQVEIKSYGSFERKQNETSLSKYCNFTRLGSRRNSISFRCYSEVRKRLKKSWAEKENIRSKVWEIKSITDSDYISTVKLELQTDGLSESLEFSISMDDWEDNVAIRKFIQDNGNGVVDNLEYEQVFVTLDEISSAECLSQVGQWKIYRLEDRPNILIRMIRRYL